MIMRIINSVVLAGIVTTAPLLAQTAPCGRTVVVADKESGRPTEERFIPSPPDHVEALTLKALPAVGAVLEQKDGLTLKAKSDGKPSGSIKGSFGRYGAWYNANKLAGVKGVMAGTTVGKWTIGLHPETRGANAGTNVKISFDSSGFGASKNAALPLMNEIDCLCGLLSRADPLANPRGTGGSVGSTEGLTLALAEGTPLKLILRDTWYSRDAAKTAGEAQLVFEVAADVVVEGAALVRKGALGVGRFVQVKGASGGGKGARMEFVIDHVTAADGQSVPVLGATESRQGKGMNTSTPNFSMGAVGGALSAVAELLQKGYETLIRAGTTFDVEVSGTHSIKVAK
jgi:hypothetical protein